MVVLAAFLLTVLVGAPYVPSRKKELTAMFDAFYELPKNEVFVDIGSGDGVVLRAARKAGFKRAVGYEINPVLVFISKYISRHDDAIIVKPQNFWRTSFSKDTGVVYTFGESRDIKKMYNKVACEAERLDKTLWFISYAFKVPGKKIHTSHGAYVLYKVVALQTKEA